MVARTSIDELSQDEGQYRETRFPFRFELSKCDGTTDVEVAKEALRDQLASLFNGNGVGGRFNPSIKGNEFVFKIPKNDALYPTPYWTMTLVNGRLYPDRTNTRHGAVSDAELIAKTLRIGS